MGHDGVENSPHGESPGSAAILPHLKELTTDALRYWELRRLFYNLLLALIMAGHFIAAWPVSRSVLTLDGIFSVFLLAVLANVAYSVVYAVDVFIQLSGFRSSRGRWRWAVLLVGF